MVVVPDALLFDLDRTLVDLQSFTDYGAARRDAARIVAEARGPALPETDWSADTVAVMALLVACSGQEVWQAVSDAVSAHERAAIARSRPMPRLEEAWALAQPVPRAVVTLLPEAVARGLLAAHGITDPGLVIVGRARDQRPKPAPDGVLAACARLGVRPGAAVMIGDSTWDHEAARAAGAGFVGVSTDGAALPGVQPVAGDLAEAVGIALGQ